MAENPNANVLEPRATTKSTTCYIFGQEITIAGKLRFSHLVEITFLGSWPSPSGLQSILNTKLGSENVIRFSSTATSAEFYAPAVDSTGAKAVYWDSQIAASIYAFSGNTYTPNIRYPAV